MGHKLKIIRRIMIAFSLYSRIPMPTFDWEDSDYAHAIAYLPLIGAVIGGLLILAVRLCDIFSLGLPTGALTAFFMALPILVTGGFHLDGYMDVADAGNAFAKKERRLKIMQDPHIGAFAVISLAKTGLLWFAGLLVLTEGWKASGDARLLYLYGLLFVLIRALCGLTCILLPGAKSDGMLRRETGDAGKAELVLLLIAFFLAAAASLAVAFCAAAVCIAAVLLFSLYYGKRCKKKFGGITGDTAGYFVVAGELTGVLSLMVYSIFIG